MYKLFPQIVKSLSNLSIYNFFPIVIYKLVSFVIYLIHDLRSLCVSVFPFVYMPIYVHYRYDIYISPKALSGEGNGTPLQYSCLENIMDGGAWQAAIHRVAKSLRLSNFTFTFHFHALEKEMTTHSSVLAWRIPGMGEPGGLPSMGSHKVRQD